MILFVSVLLEVRPHDDDGLSGNSKKEQKPEHSLTEQKNESKGKDQQRPHKHRYDKVITTSVKPNGIHGQPNDEGCRNSASENDSMRAYIHLGRIENYKQNERSHPYDQYTHARNEAARAEAMLPFSSLGGDLLLLLVVNHWSGFIVDLAKEIIHRYAEHICDLLEDHNIGDGFAAFPLRYGFVRIVETRGKVLLSHALAFSKLGNVGRNNGAQVIGGSDGTLGRCVDLFHCLVPFEGR